jgi:hypothetical protein
MSTILSKILLGEQTSAWIYFLLFILFLCYLIRCFVVEICRGWMWNIFESFALIQLPFGIAWGLSCFLRVSFKCKFASFCLQYLELKVCHCESVTVCSCLERIQHFQEPFTWYESSLTHSCTRTGIHFYLSPYLFSTNYLETLECMNI